MCVCVWCDILNFLFLHFFKNAALEVLFFSFLPKLFSGFLTGLWIFRNRTSPRSFCAMCGHLRTVDWCKKRTAKLLTWNRPFQSCAKIKLAPPSSVSFHPSVERSVQIFLPSLSFTSSWSSSITSTSLTTTTTSSISNCRKEDITSLTSNRT